MGLKEQLREHAKKRFGKEPADLPEDFEGRAAVFVRLLSGAERDDYEGSRVKYLDHGNGKVQTSLHYANLRARLVVKCLCDGDGQRIYTDADDVGRDFPGDLLDRLFEQAIRLNKLKKAEDVPEKNASATASGSSTASRPRCAGRT